MNSPARTARIAAHLILGPRHEPFLASLLRSLEDACDALIVNDNASEPSPHTAALQRSAFAARDALFVDRAPFVDFSTARNRCLDLHRAHDAGEWAAFVDADEVHGEAVTRAGAHLHRVPERFDFVDGYTWHFFQSFDWYRSIERRMAFFRVRADIRWEGAVHERLVGLPGQRLALPYVYAHYGWVLPVRRQAEKGRLYSSLGAPGEIVEEDRLDAIDREHYFRKWWRDALRFGGEHPPAAREAVERMRREFAAEFAQTDRWIREHQTRRDRLRNFFMKANYEQRWRSRALNSLARAVMQPR